VIGGDLNMCRPAIGLAAPYRPAVRGRTWPAHRPIAQIDHLLAGPGVEVRDAAVAAGQGSDHRAVRATVTLTELSRVRVEQRTAVA
jgi:endonuclease/exonuclease/phosphatase family metal-dependent hydrolase